MCIALCVLVNQGLLSGCARQSVFDPTVVAPEEFVTVFENERVELSWWRLFPIHGGNGLRRPAIRQRQPLQHHPRPRDRLLA